MNTLCRLHKHLAHYNASLKTPRRGLLAAVRCVRCHPDIRMNHSNGTAAVRCARRHPDIRMNHSNGTAAAAAARRGAMVVIEGCDRSGKTTQAKKLVEYMNASGRKTVFMRFPDRTTKIGGLIDGYLSQGINLEDHVIHLLFSANRWENQSKVLSALESGTSVIIDRYAFSGVAFSGAKEGLTLDWCKGSDAGLPRPDAVLFLDLPPEQATTRGKYGGERYEELKFQQRVYKNYMALKDATWKTIDASKSVEEVQGSVEAALEEVMEESQFGPLSLLWQS